MTKLFKNNYLNFTLSRYFGFFFQFLRGIILAKLLNPYAFGIWGLLTLVIQYLSYSNLGIQYAINIELSTNKSNHKLYIGTGVILTAFFSLLILFAYCFFLCAGTNLFKEYEFNKYSIFLIVIAILSNFTQLFSNIYRVYGKLFKIALDELLIIIVTLGVIFVVNKNILIYALLMGMIFAKVVTLIMFLVKPPFHYSFEINYKKIFNFIKQGFSLLLYNISFYLIVLSGRTVIGIFYDIKDMGYFTLANNIAQAVLLGINAIIYIVYPKMLYKLSENEAIKNVLNTLKTITFINTILVFSIVFITASFLPFIFNFLSEYRSILPTLNILLIAQAILTSCIAFNTVSVARKKQFLVAKIGISVVIMTFVIGVVFALFKLHYIYISFAVLLSSVIYAVLITKFSYNILGLKRNLFYSFFDILPKKVIIPSIIFIVLTLSKYTEIAGIITLTSFLLLNYEKIIASIDKIKVYIPKLNSYS